MIHVWKAIRAKAGAWRSSINSNPTNRTFTNVTIRIATAAACVPPAPSRPLKTSNDSRVAHTNSSQIADSRLNISWLMDLLHQIQQREQHDPENVDQVPEGGPAFDERPIPHRQ